ncbi:MAG: RHS repeat protein [Synechococcaceae cyanobacterium SM2_3_1]|nr:RHS repeat protein [Synechococcaceae cyanobacterium SM2_3_1]
MQLTNGGDESIEVVFDPDNSRETVRDGLGNPTIYEFDVRGNVVSVVDALNHQSFAEYDDENNLTEFTDPNGLISHLTYDAGNNLLSKTDPADETVPTEDIDTTFYRYRIRGAGFSSVADLTNMIFPTGASIELIYDTRGNELEIRDDSGEVIQAFTYNVSGDITSESDAFGDTNYSLDDFGNVVSSTDPFGIISTMTYDSNNRLETMTEEEVTSTFTYDDLGRELLADYGNGIFVDYGYEGDREDWTSLDAPTIGHLERRFGNNDKLGGWTLANGTTLNFIYDKAGQWIQQIDPSGRMTENEYDRAGRLIETRDLASGNVTKRDYDAGGRLIAVSDGLDQATTYTYDSKGRVQTITNARNKVTRFSYTNSSVTITDPLGRKTTTVNTEYYLPERIQYPDGTEEISRYLFSNNLQEADEYPTKLIDRGGRDRDYGYDALGRLKTATDLGSSLYQYDYGNEGLSQINSPLGETRQYAYEDALENLTRITYGDGRDQLLAYGADNRIKTVTLPSGDTINYLYNSAGEEISRTATQGGTVTATYTLDGNVDTMTDPTGVTQYHYDPAGRLSGIDFPSGQRIGYTYDVLGQVKTVSTQVRETAPMNTTEYDYDEVGNLKMIIDPLDGVTTMTYDDADRLEERLLPNGVRSTYTYDDLDQVRSIVHENSAGEVLVSVTYERNPGGEPNKITREDGSSVELEYDAALRLQRETYFDAMGALEEEIIYSYDADGKRITKQIDGQSQAYQYDPGYQLGEVTGGSDPKSYRFDQDGRVEEILRQGTTLTLDHDSYDRLTQANTISYEYDGMNRRVSSTGEVERNFLVAPAMGSGLESIHQIVDGAGVSVAEYVYAGMMPLLRQGSEGVVYYLEDGIGSVIGLVDSSGQTVSTFQYDGFGNLIRGSGSGVSAELGGDFRFQGQWLEGSTGLYHMRARDYDPVSGRFLSRDQVEPILEEPESVDPYQFGYNNGRVYSDRTGLLSMIAVNTSGVVRSIIQNARREALGQLREYLTNEINENVGKLFAKALQSLVPGNQIALDLFSSLSKPSKPFENKVTSRFCRFTNDVSGGLISYLYLFPAINKNDGEPTENGVSCPLDFNTSSIKEKNKGGVRPDFLMSPTAPLTLKQQKKKDAYFISDVKISAESVVKDVNPKDKAGQWMGMYKFAQKYAPSKAVIYIVYKRGGVGSDLEKKLIGYGLKEGVLLLILVLFD